MKYMVIKDSFYKHDWGLLEYNEETKKFRIYIRRDKHYKVYPIFMNIMIKKYQSYVIDGEFAMMWVHERLVSPFRQNIDNILRNVGCYEYDEWKLLQAYNGKCPQDDMYLETLSSNKVQDYAIKFGIALK